MEQHNDVKGSSGPERLHTILVVGAVIQLLLLVFVAVKVSNLETGTLPTGNVVAGDLPAAAAPTADVSADDDYVLGNPDATVTIIEFSDYQCPFCGRFHQETLPSIRSKYIDTGKVNLVYRDFPLSFHPMAEPAAIAANCAGEQGKYYEYHDLIFANQAVLSESALGQWAQQLGLNTADWNTCRNDPAQKAEIQKDLMDGTAAGVQGTPSFFVNGVMVSGAQPYPVFEQLIEQMLN
ncbi:disulfide bond formation protein DsbA [Candidatus Woesearchaeota archaeon CG10_big_fil_rev_8_21_14_0_10_45_16]|nr:MAG: disulfide bond formation protein DsbA [Candidatus Woesearchaeota archaeon CG10_big_fil_rev_8_21_14_0_10_45_16]